MDDALAEALTENAKILLDAKEPVPRFTAVTDEDFVRRAHLDAIGRLPDATETMRFLDDPAPDKHARLVDALLDSPEWSRQRFIQMASLFRVQDEVLGASQGAYREWLREAAEKNMPWDRLAYALLTARGDLKSNPATGYLLRDHGWLTATMSETLRIFFSVDMQCAACHDHPFTDWTQRQFYQASACLGATRISRGPPAGQPSAQPDELWPSADHPDLRARSLAPEESLFISEMSVPYLRIPQRYLYRDARPGEVVRAVLPRLPGDREPPALPSRNELDVLGAPTIRESFARWVVSHPRFAETLALRAWHSIFVHAVGGGAAIGQEPGPPGEFPTMAEAMSMNGCVASPAMAFLAPECTDATAALFFEQKLPAATSRVIRTLGTLMAEAGFDGREFQRILMHSEAYRIAATGNPSRRTPTFTPAPGIRRLSPEQLWDSLLAFIGDAPEGCLPGDRMPSTLPDGHPLRILGRGNREWGGEELRSVSWGLARFMHNSPLVAKAAARGSKLHTRCDAASSPREKITLAFLSTLNRRPSATEAAAGEAALAAGVADGLSGLLWALLNTAEFLFAR